MSRSYKKPFAATTKAWYPDDEKAYRHQMKQTMRDIGVAFDPDGDWEEANVSQKGFGDWGTRLGFKVELGPDDTWYEAQEQMKRK